MCRSILSSPAGLSTPVRARAARRSRKPSARRVLRVSSMRTSSRRAPELLQAGVAAAAEAVTLVANGALFVEVLVILLGGIERGRRDDLRHDLPFETWLLLELAFRGFGGGPLR